MTDTTEPSPAAGPRETKNKLTRQKLLDTTISCLVTHGWTGTTVGLIAEQAQISRGALQHYYRTREDIITAALDHLWTSSTRRIIEELREPAPGVSREQHVVDLLFAHYSGPVFKAALQVWTAAATDADLRARVVPLEADFGRSAHAIAVDLLHADDSDPRTHRLIEITLDMARGLGLADTLTDDSRRRREIAKTWSEELRTIKTLSVE
ncbi:TetR/AcrR family transcriptional regulator [Gordonia sp. (in: high G+C Gram-positive bacteria)]|uniref:TetR/AcrR family transcriptional regulator n=1 Tax=Gordonia sp. (in: high G+C Gram-positive bacteria) TaxID=84139 RepID=UPI003C77E581